MRQKMLYAEAVYDNLEIEAVIDILRNQPHALMNGPKVEQLEKEVSQLFGKKSGIMVNSGSSANLVALASIGISDGDEIITPALTFATTVAPIVQLGATPVFVDSKDFTYCIDENFIEEKITDKTRALMIPNLIGNLPNWPKIQEIAKTYNLIVIEDSADTIGATLNGVSSGNFSDISTTSFYASHVVTGAGFGGMLSTSNQKYIESAKLLRGWGRNSSLFGESESIEKRFAASVGDIEYDAKFIFSQLGFNFLPSEISAAFAIVQLKKLEKNIKHREKNHQILDKIFGQYSEYFHLPMKMKGSKSGWIAYPICISDSAPFTRKEFQVFFEENNIQTRTVFTGNILRQPGFKNIQCVGNVNDFPNADKIMRYGVLVGCHNGLTQEHFEHFEQVLENFLSKYISH